MHNEETKGKNENARRIIGMAKMAMVVLNSHFKKLDELGIHSDVLFCKSDGEPIPEKSYYERWVEYRGHNGIETPVTLYQLRHSFVSIVKTLPEGYLKQLVGHSKDMDTYGIYSHEMANERDIIADMIQDRFDEILGEIEKSGDE